MKTQLKIEGMSCGHCVAGVRSALQAVEGVQTAEVSLERGFAEVDHDEAATPKALVAAVEEEGYTARVL